MCINFSPVDFIDDHERRWAYASGFAILSYRVLMLFNQEYIFEPSIYDDPEFMEQYGWTTSKCEKSIKEISVCSKLTREQVYHPMKKLNIDRICMQCVCVQHTGCATSVFLICCCFHMCMKTATY